MIVNIACRPRTFSDSEAVLQSTEKNVAFLQGQNYATQYENEILPYLKANSTEGFLASDDAFNKSLPVELAYRITNPNQSKAIFVLNGQGESYLKFNEFVYEFARRGYTIYQLDPRGQGLSTRLSQFSFYVNHLDLFDYYVSDFAKYFSIHAPQHQKVSFFSHSTGGAVLTRFLAENYHSLPLSLRQKITGAAMSAPLFGINTGKIPVAITWIITAGSGLIGKAAEFIPGSGPVNLDEPHSEKAGTSDSQRYNAYYKYLRIRPEAVGGGASNRWVSELVASCNRNLTLSEKVTLPVLVFQAANDTYVLPKPQEEFCAKAKNCTLIRVPNSRHEIFREGDGPRLQEFRTVEKFFAAPSYPFL